MGDAVVNAAVGSSGKELFARACVEYAAYVSPTDMDPGVRALHRARARSFFEMSWAAGYRAAIRGHSLIVLDDLWSMPVQFPPNFPEDVAYLKRTLAFVSDLMLEYLNKAMKKMAGVNPVYKNYFSLTRRQGLPNLNWFSPEHTSLLQFLLTLDLSDRYHKYLAVPSSDVLSNILPIARSITRSSSFFPPGYAMNFGCPVADYAAYLESKDPAVTLSHEVKDRVAKRVYRYASDANMSYAFPEMVYAKIVDLSRNYFESHADCEGVGIADRLEAVAIEYIRLIKCFQIPISNPAFELAILPLQASQTQLHARHPQYNRYKALAQCLIGAVLEGKDIVKLSYTLARPEALPTIESTDGLLLSVGWYQAAVQGDAKVARQFVPARVQTATTNAIKSSARSRCV